MIEGPAGALRHLGAFELGQDLVDIRAVDATGLVMS